MNLYTSRPSRESVHIGWFDGSEARHVLMGQRVRDVQRRCFPSPLGAEQGSRFARHRLLFTISMSTNRLTIWTESTSIRLLLLSRVALYKHLGQCAIDGRGDYLSNSYRLDNAHNSAKLTHRTMFSHLALLALPVLGLTTAVSAQSTAYNRAACASSFVEVSPGVPSGQFYTDDTTCGFVRDGLRDEPSSYH